MNIRKVLVAGGAGFIGSHLCDLLIDRGLMVIAVDNLSTGSKKNIRHLFGHPYFQFLKGDVCNQQWIKKSFGHIQGKKDWDDIKEIYHLASPASPYYYQKDPIVTWKANTIGTYNLLELARRHDAKFLFASTSEVYGDPLIHPQKENYCGNVNPIGPRACYDESKRAGEALVMDYYRKFKTEVKIVRIFNTYGPKMDKNDGRVVSNFITQALAQRPLTVYGTGKQTRSFMYVDDLIKGMVKMMLAKFTGPVNLGNPQELAVLDFAKKIIKLTGSLSRVVYRVLPKDDPRQRKPDIALAKRRLNWQPKVDLKTGLLKTIDYFKNGR